jgi:predicted nuclease with TOPRIM domain
MATPPSSIEERMARLEGSYEQIDRRLGTLEQDVRGLRVDLNAWVDRVDSRFGQIESQIELVNTSRLLKKWLLEGKNTHFHI